MSGGGLPEHASMPISAELALSKHHIKIMQESYENIKILEVIKIGNGIGRVNIKHICFVCKGWIGGFNGVSVFRFSYKAGKFEKAIRKNLDQADLSKTYCNRAICRIQRRYKKW